MVSTHQNIAEFWNVATRPASARGGFGLDPGVVEKQVATIEKLGQLVPFDDVAGVDHNLAAENASECWRC